LIALIPHQQITGLLLPNHRIVSWSKAHHPQLAAKKESSIVNSTQPKRMVMETNLFHLYHLGRCTPPPDSLNFDWENMRRVSAGGQRNLSASMPSALAGRGELKSLEKQLRREDRMERTKDFSFNVEEEIDGIAQLKKWRTITIPEDLTAGRHTTEEQKKLANLYKSRMREKWVVRRIGDVLRQAVEECQILDEQKGLNENAIVEGLLDQLSQLV